MNQTSDSFTYGTPGTIRTYDTWFRRPVLYPLSYGCVHDIGGPGGARTLDTLLKRQVL